MTSKQRVYAAFEGKIADRMGITVMYCPLYFQDHYGELTGRPQWEWRKWVNSLPHEYLRIYSDIIRKAPFDILQPMYGSSREARENLEFKERDGQVFQRDRRSDTWEPLIADTVSGHATDYRANEEQLVFDKADVNEQVKAIPAQTVIETGVNDYLEAVVKEYGDREFILSGGVVGTVYGCGGYLGQSNTFATMKEQPDLVEYLSWKIVEVNVEEIRRLATGGGDAVYIDDATATSDMISVGQYERFSLPFMKAMVDEIHKLGQKAIVIYFGGIADRLEQIVATGADALAPETSMKGYVNDIVEFAEKIGGRITLFGNVNPVNCLEKATDEELEQEVKRQIAAGRKARGFVVCTGSPITPKTSLPRVQYFIELARKYGLTAC